MLPELLATARHRPSTASTSLRVTPTLIQGTDPALMDTWQHPCNLEPELLQQRILDYDMAEFDLVGAAQALLGSSDLRNLHTASIRPPEHTAPALRRGQIQARVGSPVSKSERKAARTHAWRFERTDEWRHFMEVYRRLVLEWVQPQLGGVPLLYQRKPILRVVMPGCPARLEPSTAGGPSAAGAAAHALVTVAAQLGPADEAALRRRLPPQSERTQLVGAVHTLLRQ